MPTRMPESKNPAQQPAALELPRASRVLAFAPHADDDVLGAGGALALHARRGDRVRVVVAFDGKLGLAPGVDPRVRREEALAAGEELGVRDFAFWDYPEGHEPAPSELELAVERVARELADCAPDVVYAPWSGDEHVDHRVLARVTRAALERARFAGRAFGYEVWSACPADVVLDVGAVWPQKLAALARHRSQLARTDLAALALGNAQRAGRWLGPARFGEAFVETRWGPR
ncbi:MAG: PIG-L family deacetylase [Planctomycetes bacterium]|nr:PIG-L family deacetylase [Planctomycetota bacterium]